ncbi:MAG TPA: ribonuclease J [Candidatus Peregrinibacteria bacterium]|nr:ribonuclease J [Candidatus Peregrinibacteria bacterium]
MNKLSKWISKTVSEKSNSQKKHFSHHKKFQKKPFVSKGKQKTKKLRIIPLGGLEEIGKNMMCIEYGQDIVIVDAGIQFPEVDMYGVDFVIPDTSYLEDKKERIRGIILTHGHLDHIGALPYLLPKLNFPPLYGTSLTLGLARARLGEFNLESKTTFKQITAKDRIRLGSFDISFFHVNHSIPDGVGIMVRTPAGNLVHTGDFKFDFTPANDSPSDFSKIARLGAEGVLVLLSDSTNAMEPGYTPSEKKVGETLERIIEKAKGRLVIASFSSLIGRIQQIINFAHKYDRKVFVSGRSMVNNITTATKLGYLKIPKGIIRQIQTLRSFPPQRTIILTTGSQGEEMSALARISLGNHMQIQIRPSDTIVFSSSPIIGNEKSIAAITNNLIRLGAKVITNKLMDVHTSGHGSQEDLKLMLNLIRPKYLVPIHGELRMREAHKEIATSLGMEERNAVLLDNGNILEIENQQVRKSKSKVPANDILIDGLGVGDVGSQVQRDRQVMAENGVIIVLFKAYQATGNLIGDPEIVTRGFIYMKESQEIVNEAKQIAKKAYAQSKVNKINKENRKDLKNDLRRSLGNFVQKKLGRRPMILPVIIKV